MNANTVFLTAGLVALLSGAAAAEQPTPTVAFGAAYPNPVLPGGAVLTTVHIKPGSIDIVAPYTVIEELRVLGVKDETMFDDGTHGDQQEGDNTYTLEFKLAETVKPGIYPIAFAVIDPPSGDAIFKGSFELIVGAPPCNADFDGDGKAGTDADIEAFFSCVGGLCCKTCGSADFDGDGDAATDADIEAFFRVLGGGPC